MTTPRERYYLPDAIEIIKKMGLPASAVPMDDANQIEEESTPWSSLQMLRRSWRTDNNRTTTWVEENGDTK